MRKFMVIVAFPCLLFGHCWQKVGFSWLDYEEARFREDVTAAAMLLIPYGHYCTCCKRFERIR